LISERNQYDVAIKIHLSLLRFGVTMK
jgi:hypothetical protein